MDEDREISFLGYDIHEFLRKGLEMIDHMDSRILQALDGNARLPLNEIARRIGLSSPSVSERLKRLEERGVIRAFTLDVDPGALGYTLQAMVRIRPLPGKVRAVETLLQDTPQVIECDKVTGEDCYVARIVIGSIGELDLVVDRFALMAETNTSIVKSQPVPRRLPPLGADQAGHRQGMGSSGNAKRNGREPKPPAMPEM